MIGYYSNRNRENRRELVEYVEVLFIMHTRTIGYTAFLVHRISGLLIVAYLYLHLILLSAILMPHGASRFNAVARVVEQPLFLVADIVLFAVILIHAINGIRLILADFGLMIRQNRLAVWLSMTVGAIVLFIMALAMVPAIVR